MAYRRSGQGAPLLLVHGFPLDSSSWDELTPLLERDFDIIAPDLRGFGQSSTVKTPYTITDMADDLAALLDHLGIEKTAIAGHSMGGYVALAFAKKYPERVTGLALISSQTRSDTPEGRLGRFKTAEEVMEKGVSVLEPMSFKLTSDRRVQNFARALVARQNSAGVIGALRAMAERDDNLSVLTEADYPIVLIHGVADLMIPIDRAREIKQAVEVAYLVELPGAGHMPMLELSRETAGILKFLKS